MTPLESQTVTSLLYMNDAMRLISDGAARHDVTRDFLSDLNKNEMSNGVNSVAQIRTQMMSICKLLKRLVGSRTRTAFRPTNFKSGGARIT